MRVQAKPRNRGAHCGEDEYDVDKVGEDELAQMMDSAERKSVNYKIQKRLENLFPRAVAQRY